MKIRTSCSYCDKTYDYYLDKCPHCNEPNKDDGVRNSQHITMVAFWKQLLYFFVGWLGFQGIAILFSTILVAIKKPVTNDDVFYYNAIVNFGSYGLLFLIICALSFNDHKKIFASFKLKRWKPYVFGLVGLMAIFSFTYTYNIILAIIGYTPEVNSNEAGVRSIVTAFPLLSLLVFGVIGPICEEFTYRVGLFSFFRRIHISLAYIVSIIVFALIHFDFGSIGTSSFINELVNLPSYLFSGATFAFLYHKLGLASSLTAHITNNLIAMGMTIIGNLLG